MGEIEDLQDEISALELEKSTMVEGWMATYGDMVTLLFAFFVLLYAMSDPDPGKFEEFSQAMKKAFSKEEQQNEFEDLEKNLQEIMKEKELIGINIFGTRFPELKVFFLFKRHNRS